jgi:hypothetical protein
MRFSLLAFTALGVTSIGCFSRARSTEVAVRDATDLTVSADTPHGRDVVLPPGPASAEVPVPMSAPPYVGPARLPILARREESGATLLRCDRCAWREGTVIADGSGQIVLEREGARSIRWNGERLLWNLDQEVVRSHVGRFPYMAPIDVAQVVVSTPKSNVVAAERVSRPDVGVGVAEIVLALPLVIGGGYLAATAGADKYSGLRTVGGAILATFGLVIGASGVTMVLPESRTPVE